VPVLCYASEACNILKSDSKGHKAGEMKFLRNTAGYKRWGHKINDILMELNTKPVLGILNVTKNTEGAVLIE
jgi:hypothetical protein